MHYCYTVRVRTYLGGEKSPLVALSITFTGSQYLNLFLFKGEIKSVFRNTHIFSVQLASTAVQVRGLILLLLHSLKNQEFGSWSREHWCFTPPFLLSCSLQMGQEEQRAFVVICSPACTPRNEELLACFLITCLTVTRTQRLTACILCQVTFNQELEISGFLLLAALCFELVEMLPFQVPVQEAPKFKLFCQVT